MLPILYCQYHACWCPGDLNHQGISRLGIDQISQNRLSLSSKVLILKNDRKYKYSFMIHWFSMTMANKNLYFGRLNANYPDEFSALFLDLNMRYTCCHLQQLFVVHGCVIDIMFVHFLDKTYMYLQLSCILKWLWFVNKSDTKNFSCLKFWFYDDEA